MALGYRTRTAVPKGRVTPLPDTPTATPVILVKRAAPSSTSVAGLDEQTAFGIPNAARFSALANGIPS
jgi:hypothetical protein